MKTRFKVQGSSDKSMYTSGKVYLIPYTLLHFIPFFLILCTLYLAPCTLYAETKLDFFFKEIKITKVNETSATIKWETSLPSQGMIKYGKNAMELFGISYDVPFKEKHQITLKNLSKGTLYWFKIIASRSNNKIVSPINKFVTKGTPPLSILINKVFDITKNSAKIGWAFSQPVKAKLKYLEVGTTDYIEYTADKIDKSGAFILTKLKPDTSYYYIIEGENRDGKSVKSKVKYFRTKEWNLALTKPVTGTFNKYIYDDKFFNKKTSVLQRITDGKLNYFDGMAVSGNVYKKDQYAIIDLKRIYSIGKIKVYWRALSYSRDYALYVSNDKESWDLVAKHIDAKKGKKMRGEKGDPILCNEITCNRKARYIKILIKKGSKVYNKHKKWNFVQLMEIKILP